jgi:hypothetical protein
MNRQTSRAASIVTVSGPMIFSGSRTCPPGQISGPEGNQHQGEREHAHDPSRPIEARMLRVGTVLTG